MKAMKKTSLPGFTGKESLASHSNSSYSYKTQQQNMIDIFPMAMVCSWCPVEEPYPCGSNIDGTTMYCTRVVDWAWCNCIYIPDQPPRDIV